MALQDGLRAAADGVRRGGGGQRRRRGHGLGPRHDRKARRLAARRAGARRQGDLPVARTRRPDRLRAARAAARSADRVVGGRHPSAADRGLRAARYCGRGASRRTRLAAAAPPDVSSLAQAVVRRAALPVLGLFLCLLAANAAVAPSLNTRRRTLQKELSARERTASTAADATDRQRTLLAEFSARPAASRAVVCDRIAEAVPAQVVLTRLAVEPLTMRFEAGKPLQRQERTAVVAGTAPAADDVSTFVECLAGAACCRTVRLTNVERERDAERLVFRIEIGL